MKMPRFRRRTDHFAIALLVGATVSVLLASGLLYHWGPGLFALVG
jgi:hypothetical protein